MNKYISGDDSLFVHLSGLQNRDNSLQLSSVIGYNQIAYCPLSCNFIKFFLIDHYKKYTCLNCFMSRSYRTTDIWRQTHGSQAVSYTHLCDCFRDWDVCVQVFNVKGG